MDGTADPRIPINIEVNRVIGLLDNFISLYQPNLEATELKLTQAHAEIDASKFFRK